MLQITTLTEDLLDKHISDILTETKDFGFNNWNRENFYISLPDKWNLSIAILYNQVFVGFSINSRKQDIFYIHFFYIFKNHRNSNKGFFMLKECEKRAIDYGLKLVQLKCQFENKAALNFYLKHGFSITGKMAGHIYHLLEKKPEI